MQIPTIQGYVICCHEHFVVVGDVNNGVMTTLAANNGYAVVTELPMTSQWFGMLRHHKYALIWCDGTKILSIRNILHIFVYVV